MLYIEKYNSWGKSENVATWVCILGNSHAEGLELVGTGHLRQRRTLKPCKGDKREGTKGRDDASRHSDD